MKTLTLLLCTALAVTAEVAVNTNSEHLRNLATLLQEHHRFVRQATTPPSTEGATSSTAPPPTSTDGSEVTPTTESIMGNSSACENALSAFVQSCVLAHGLSLETLAAQLNGSNAIDVYAQLYAIYCSDGRCQADLFNYYEACIGSEVRWLEQF